MERHPTFGQNGGLAGSACLACGCGQLCGREVFCHASICAAAASAQILRIGCPRRQGARASLANALQRHSQASALPRLPINRYAIGIDAVGLAQFKNMALVAKVESLDRDSHPQVWKLSRIVWRSPCHPGAILAAPHGFKLPLAGFANFFGASVHGRACVLCSILVRPQSRIYFSGKLARKQRAIGSPVDRLNAAQQAAY